MLLVIMTRSLIRLDNTDSLYTNDTLDTIDIYYTRGKLIPIAIMILVILI